MLYSFHCEGLFSFRYTLHSFFPSLSFSFSVCHCVTGNICCSYFLYLVRHQHLTSKHTQKHRHNHIHDPTPICPSFLPLLFSSLYPSIKYCLEWSWNVIVWELSWCVTSIQTAADTFGWGAFKVGCRSVYEGAGHAGLGLGSPAVTELRAQSQEAGLGRRFWCV